MESLKNGHFNNFKGSEFEFMTFWQMESLKNGHFNNFKGSELKFLTILFYEKC